MSSLASILLSLGVVMAILLIGGGTLALRRPGERKRAILMIVAGLVTLANVYLYATIPAIPPQVGR